MSHGLGTNRMSLALPIRASVSAIKKPTTERNANFYRPLRSERVPFVADSSRVGASCKGQPIPGTTAPRWLEFPVKVVA